MRKRTSNRTLRAQSAVTSYQNLEPRRVLAAVASFASGTLNIDFDAANDVAMVDVDGNGNITINGSDQIDDVGFSTTIAASSVASIGSLGSAGSSQQLSLNASLSALTEVNVSGVDSISFQESYVLENLELLDVTTVSQSLGTSLTVFSEANIAAAGDVLLDSPGNDFNLLTVAAANVAIGDVNNVLLGSIEAAGEATVTASENIQADHINVAGNVLLDAGSNLDLGSLVGNSVTLNAGGAIANAAGAVIDVQRSLTIIAGAASLGAMPDDSLAAARITAEVQNALEIEQESNVRLLDVSAGELSVVSGGTITNRADATIDVPGDVRLSATNIVIGQTATDTFNAGRLSFESPNIVRIIEDSSTEIFGDNEARVLAIESYGDITDEPNSMIDIAFSTMFIADNVTVGDTPADAFNSRTLSFQSPGKVDVTQDSRVFLTSINQSDQLALSSPVSILDSPTTQVDVGGEVSFESPYINVGDLPSDSFNAGMVNFGTSDRVNFSEDSDTVLGGSSDVRQAIVRTVGAMSNDVGAAFSAEVATLLADGDIALGAQPDDYLDIDRMRFETVADVTIDQDDSVFLFGNNAAANLRLISSGPIGDSGTAVLEINDHAWLSGTTIWLGEQSTDVFNAGRLTFEAVGNVVISESSSMLLAAANSAFNLSLTADGAIEDDALAETMAQRSVTFRASEVTVGELETDCFDIVDGPSKLLVISPVSTIVFGC